MIKDWAVSLFSHCVMMRIVWKSFEQKISR
jgi:hypothetical protein